MARRDSDRARPAPHGRRPFEKGGADGCEELGRRADPPRGDAGEDALDDLLDGAGDGDVEHAGRAP